MPLETPSYMPPGPPASTSTVDLLEYRPVPGISFHADDDGILYYYDQPLVFVAWFQGEMVLATLTDEDYEGPPERAKGWKQTFLVGMTPELLMRAYNSEVPFRALYDQPEAKTWFIHEDWQHNGDKTWNHQIQLFENVPLPATYKPDEGTYLDPGKPADAATAP